MNRILGWFEKFGPLGISIPRFIKSNNKRQCLDCSVKITSSNDSGWEGFTEDGVTTQPLCIKCNKERDEIKGYKEDDSIH